MARPWILEYDTANCTIGAAVSAIGEKWTFLVLREAFNGVRRFDDMRRRTQAPRQVLSDRLSRLVADGMLRRVPYQERGQRARHEYRLTQKGLDLYPVLVALMEWGDRYAACRPARRCSSPTATAGPASSSSSPAPTGTCLTRRARSPRCPGRAPARSPEGHAAGPGTSPAQAAYT